MDSLNIEEIVDGINNGSLSFSDIEEQVKKTHPMDIDKIIDMLAKEEDKIPFIKEAMRQSKIIRFLESDELKVEAIKELRTDEDKLKAITKFLKTDSSKMKAIKELNDPKLIKKAGIVLSREDAKEFFLKKEKIKYSEIGLDKKITLGMEIESEGQDSKQIIEIGKNNGVIINEKMSGSMDVNMECGTTLKRRGR